MRVFVTGATGFIGSAVVQELLGAGHQVLGLARSEKAVRALTAAGAQAHMGSLDDLDSLTRGAQASDGVIHLAFIHDFAAYAAAGESDRRAIDALGSALAGSDRPLIVTAGLAGFTLGRPATENDVPAASPRLSEQAAMELAAQGVHASAVRLSPSVHDDGDYGFVPTLIDIARKKGEAAYVGDGLNRWPSRASARCRPPFSAGIGKGRDRYQVSRSCRRGRANARHSRHNWLAAERTCRF